MLASVSAAKRGDGTWTGVNLTWYGFLTATCYLLAVVLWLVLLASAGVGLGAAVRLVAAYLGTALVTQGWRACSETLRADHRGEEHSAPISAWRFWGLAGALPLLGVSPGVTHWPPSLGPAWGCWLDREWFSGSRGSVWRCLFTPA